MHCQVCSWPLFHVQLSDSQGVVWALSKVESGELMLEVSRAFEVHGYVVEYEHGHVEISCG